MPDRTQSGSVRPRREVDELLEVLSAWRRWRILGELEYEIEDLSDVLGEIGNVVIEIAVVDGEETDLVVFERHELGEVGCADAVQVVGYSVAPRAQEQLHLEEAQCLIWQARSPGMDSVRQRR